MATEPLITPAASFPANKTALQPMPTRLAAFPYALRTRSSRIFPLSGIRLSIHFINTAKPFLIRPFFSSFGQCRSEKRAGILGNIRHRSKESFRARKTRGKRWSCGSVAVGRQSAAFRAQTGMQASHPEQQAAKTNRQDAGCIPGEILQILRLCARGRRCTKGFNKAKSPVKDGRS